LSHFLVLNIAAIGCGLIIALFPGFVLASEAGQHDWLTITWENDVIASDDSGYTNGIGVSWGHGPLDQFTLESVPNWIYHISQWLPYSKDAGNTHGISYQVSQLMYTPHDIQATEVVEDDRPYAGVLLWTPHLHSYRESFSNRYWLSLGAVGPVAGAEEVQELIHNIIDVPTAKGWDNQLENEAVFVLGNERLYRLRDGAFRNGWEYDVIGMSELLAGTLRSELGAGFGLRVGRRLQQSFPAASLIPGRNSNPLAGSLKHEWHVFINVYGRYVFNDISLDGNYNHDSHSVTLTNEQAFVSIGGAWHNKRWGVVTSFQEGTRTFDERLENTQFGSFTVTYRW
jgi:lipid A 3-O-deacylase